MLQLISIGIAFWGWHPCHKTMHTPTLRLVICHCLLWWISSTQHNSYAYSWVSHPSFSFWVDIFCHHTMYIHQLWGLVLSLGQVSDKVDCFHSPLIQANLLLFWKGTVFTSHPYFNLGTFMASLEMQNLPGVQNI